MEHLKPILMVALTVSLFLLVLEVGFAFQLRDLAALLRRPGRLLKAILAVDVIVPVAAWVLVTLVGVSREAAAGILLMSISPAPPLVPGKQMQVGGDAAYGYCVYAVLIVLALVTVPLSLEVLNAIYGVDFAVPPGAIGRNVAMGVILPLLVGMAVRRWAPGLAERIAGRLRGPAMLLLLAAFLPILFASLPTFAAMLGDGTLLVMALLVVVAFAAGHLLGGPSPGDRSALAVTAATRHPGIALMLAKANIADVRVSAAVLGMVLVSLLASIPYQRLVKRRRAAHVAT
jgi:BASS family bile acid:Na+ symporter